jgi:diacylglycerol kinase (ATP)
LSPELGLAGRTVIIVNPNAGQGAAAKVVSRLGERLRALGIEHSLELTREPWHAADLARTAALEGYGVVVAAGGDGTANEVLNGVMEARLTGGSAVAMGVIPVGRGNDFAFGAGVPLSLEPALQALAAGHQRAIDVGRVTGGLYPSGRYFGNGVGIGFDAIAGLEAAKLRRLRGVAGYAYAALRLLATYSGAPLLRVVAGAEEMTERAAMVSVMNGRRMGGAFFMAPSAANDDGVLELCLTRETGRLAMFGLFVRFLRGTQAASPAVRVASASRLTVEALEGLLVAHVDGETICTAGTSLEIECLPRAVDLIVPA